MASNAVYNAWAQLRRNRPEIEGWNQPPAEPMPLDNIDYLEAQREPAGLTEEFIKMQANLGRAIPEAPKGSGATNTGHVGLQSDAKTATNRALFLSAPEIQELAGGIAQIPQVQAVEQGQKKLDDLLAMEMRGQPAQLDLSPLLALTDTWSGSKLLSGYTKPEGGAARRDKLLSYAEKIQDNRRDVAKTIIDAIGKSKSGSTLDQLVEQIKATAGGKKQDPTIHVNAGGENTFLREQRSKLLKLSEDVAVHKKNFEELESAFKPDPKTGQVSYAGVAAALAPFSREKSAERGVLTEGDISRTIPNNWRTSLSKFLSYFSETPSTEVDPLYTQELLRLTRLARQNTLNKYKDQMTAIRGLYGKGAKYYTPEAENNLKTIEDQISKFMSKPQRKAVKDMTPEERRKFIEEHRKK
jgi:hypothetical protein